jgi:hypothetical protein
MAKEQTKEERIKWLRGIIMLAGLNDSLGVRITDGALGERIVVTNDSNGKESSFYRDNTEAGANMCHAYILGFLAHKNVAIAKYEQLNG